MTSNATAFGGTVNKPNNLTDEIRNARGAGRTGNAWRKLWGDRGPGREAVVSVSEYTIQKDNGDPKVTTAVSNIGHDELMKLRRRAFNKKPPLTDRQRRQIHDKRQESRQESDLSGVQTSQQRLESMLAAAGNDPVMRRRVIDLFETNPSAAVASDPLAAAKARVVLHDLDWLFGQLMETRQGIEDGVIAADVGATNRMSMIREFDIDTVSSRDMLEAATAGLIGKRRLLTPQERDTLLARVPMDEPLPAEEAVAEPAPETAKV